MLRLKLYGNCEKKNKVSLDHSCGSYLKKRGYKVPRVWECKVQKLKKEMRLCVLAA